MLKIFKKVNRVNIFFSLLFFALVSTCLILWPVDVLLALVCLVGTFVVVAMAKAVDESKNIKKL